MPFKILFLQREQVFLFNLVGLFILHYSNIAQGFQSKCGRWLLSQRLFSQKDRNTQVGKEYIQKNKSHSQVKEPEKRQVNI